MKILFVLTPSFNPQQGGVQRIIEKLGSYFDTIGYEVQIFSFDNKGHQPPQFGKLIHANEVGGLEIKNNIEFFTAYIHDFDPDIVLNEMPYEVKLRIALASCKTNMKFKLIGCLNNSLFSVKDNIDEYGKAIFSKKIAHLLKNKLGRAVLAKIHWIKHRRDLQSIIDLHDKFVLPTGSKKNIEELRYFIGNYNLGKVRCIPNSIPDFEIENSQHKLNKILYVGRLNEGQKRSNLLLNVWQIISEQLPNWEFDIIGDGPYKQKIAEEISKRRLQRIKLLGFQNPDKFYKRSKIFLMTSAFEGFPSVLLEAQSNQVVPVVFESYPAISWIVNNGKDALLVPAYNIERFSQMVIALANDIEKLDELARNGVANAKKYTVNNVGKQWVNLFKLEISGG